MLRRTSGLSRPVLKWVSQVAASLGATLSATLIWSAVPHPGAAPGGPGGPRDMQAVVQPELTSGGKFAARAVHPMALDGVDAAPLPHVAPAPARFVLASLDPALSRTMRRNAWDEAGAAVPERRAGRPQRPSARAEAHRAVPGERAEPALPAESAPSASPVPAAAEPAEEGLFHRFLPVSVPSFVPDIASTAREAWTATASAGDALVAHVVPRMP